MRSVIEIRVPSEFDRQTVREFFYAKPLIERGKYLFDEMLWVLKGLENEDQHLKSCRITATIFLTHLECKRHPEHHLTIQ